MFRRGLPVVVAVCLAAVFSLHSTVASAQRAHRGSRAPRAVVVVGPYYSPYFYDSFYWSALHAPYAWPAGPRFYGAGYDARSSVRLQVTPRETEVFVDGYLAGTVDDFDGVFQRLPLPPGQHTIVLYLEGYRTVTQTVYLTPGHTFRVRHAMEPLAAGETGEPPPLPPVAPPAPAPASPPPPGMPTPHGQGPGVSATESAFGTLSIRVQPAGAEVLIDGEAWQGPESGSRLAVQVAAGTHRVEVRLDGYDVFVTDVQVARGQTRVLNVSLLQRDR